MPRPGEPFPLAYNSGEVEGGWHCTMTLNMSSCAKLWPKESPGKSFGGRICETRRLAEESAAQEFWKDPNVKKAAFNLPPSKRAKSRYDAQNDYFDRLEARKARRARLAEEQEQAKRMNFRKAAQ